MILFCRKHKICVLVVSCLAITILFSCGDREDETLDLETLEPETLDLFEAFFRYKFDNNYSGAQQNAEAYFLEIDGEDPPPEFLARFEGHSPPVKKGSEFIMWSEFVRGNGLLFRIDSYKRFGRFRNRAIISGGYSEGDLSASWASYIWVRRKGKWELKSVGSIAIA